MCNQMGCGTSSESVNTGNVSPQPSDYYVERASGVSRANLVSFPIFLKRNFRCSEFSHEKENWIFPLCEKLEMF